MKPGKQHPLHINVGFLLHQSVGSRHELAFDLPAIQVTEDLDVDFLRGTVWLTRTAQGLYLQGRLQGATEVDCVRCLEPFHQKLDLKLGDLLVQGRGGDPLLRIPESGFLNLAPLLREYMLLSIPSQPTCRVECQGLCAICGTNLNHSTCDHPDLEIDPRLQALKSLLDDSVTPEEAGA